MDTKTLTRAPREPERRAAAGMTGRYLVTYREGSDPQVNSQLSTIGLRTTMRSDYRSRTDGSVTALERGMTQSFPSLGVALVDALPEQEDQLHQMSAQDNNILAIEPERINRPVSQEYIAGFRDGVNSLSEKLISPPRGHRRSQRRRLHRRHGDCPLRRLPISRVAPLRSKLPCSTRGSIPSILIFLVARSLE